MSRRMRKGLLALLVCASILFCGLWVKEARSMEELEQLCRYSALQAKKRFEDFQFQESSYDYAYGVAELTSYYNAYTLLITQSQGDSNTNGIWLNQLLGELMKYPQLTQEQRSTLIEALGILTTDISSDTAYQMLFGLFNELAR